jgi:multicomponent Na+:H+ antiporter subunit C
MSGWLAVVAGITIAAGTYLSLSRDILRTVVGISLIGIAANLVLFAMGRPGVGGPPFIAKGQDALDATGANPLPQALVLTAIVIGFALTCFSFVLILAVKQRIGVADSDALEEAEPPPGPEGKPAFFEEPEEGS